MEFRILGPLEAREGAAPVVLAGVKQRALLTVFLLHANEVVPTDLLIDALWEEPPANASKAVQVYVSRLRKALGGAVPTRRSPGYLLELGPDQLDLARFRRLRDEARRDPAHTRERLEQALALWRGPALAEFVDEPFARAERLRLEEERLEALEERIDADLAVGLHRALVGELEALVTHHPLRERLRGQLMLALYRSGRQAEALAVYREGRRTLVEELGIEPGRALQQLEKAILRHDSALEPAASGGAEAAAPPAPLLAASAAPGEPSPRPNIREERKLVSVLFAGLAPTTRTGGLGDPEDVRATLRRFHPSARREIERFGGTVESVVGDTVMAVFGAPAAHEDDPERAVRAALAIRRGTSGQAGELHVRMGIDTGMALVALGLPPENEPITAGDVVNVAQRLQLAAPANGILVSERTYRATSETIEYRAAASAEATAREGVGSGWEAVAALPRRGVDLVREPRTLLVGRGRELELLGSALGRAVEERTPQLVTLVGLPGIGKSRLVFELARTLEQEGEPIAWLQGRCLSYGDGVSFWALGEIVKTQAGILESDSREPAEQKLRTAVAEVLTAEDEAAWVERELRPLVGADDELRAGQPVGERFAAWRRFLEGIAERSPLVLVLEDLHWADEGLLEFVDELADRVRSAPLLILCTARPELLERRPGWGGGKANALTISLTPLSDDETGQLVATLLEQPRLDAATHEALLARAAGNPLYAEQFARALAEIGSLETLPETVHGIIAARLDGLPPAEKALLQDAAVVGKLFWLGALEAIGDIAHGQAEEQLQRLERHEFVRKTRRSSREGEAEYVFAHILLGDVAYAQIPRTARAEKHRRAAAWIESLGRPDDHAELLAHHYLAALDYTKAAGEDDPDLVERTRRALRAAGARALSLTSYTAAARFYDTALELWPETDPDRVWLLVQAGRARHAADGTGIDLLEQGFEQLRARQDAEPAAEVAVETARCFWLGGDRDRAYAYIDRALELTDGRSHSRARAYALVERAAYHMNASDNAPATRLAREALPLTETLGLDDARIRALDVLGSSRSFRGDLAGLDDSRQAIALARERNAFSRLIVAELNLHCQHFFLGQLDAAAEVLSAARHDVGSYGTADQRNWLRVAEAHDAVLQGRWEEAIRLLDERIAEADAGFVHYLDPQCRALRAVIALARGNVEVAAADSETALERARQTKDPQVLASALTVRALALLTQGERKPASRISSEMLERGHVLVTALLELQPAVTPIELAWLLRDLGREAELVPTLASAPPTPWLEAARAIAQGDLAHSVDLVACIGAASVEAYARLRAAEELARLGRDSEAKELLAPARAFYSKVGATRYLARANALLPGAT